MNKKWVTLSVLCFLKYYRKIENYLVNLQDIIQVCHDSSFTGEAGS